MIGKTVLVTRDAKQAPTFSEKLADVGANPLTLPLIDIQPVKPDEEILKKMDTYTWLVFTSQNGVENFLKIVKDVSEKKIAAVGAKTAAALAEYGVRIAIVPTKYEAVSLANALERRLFPEDRVLIVKGNLAGTVVKDTLKVLDIYADELTVYETVEHQGNQVKLAEILREKKIDAVTFASPSVVRSYMKAVENLPEELWKPLVYACIGPVTEKVAVEAGLTVAVCPETYTFEVLIDEMCHFWRKR